MEKLKNLLNSRRVKKFINLYLSNIKIENGSLNIPLETSNIDMDQIKDIYSKLLILYTKDKFDIVQIRYFGYDYPGKYFAVRKYKKDLKNSLLKEIETTLGILERKIPSKEQLIDDIYLSEIFKTSEINYSDERLVTISDLLSEYVGYDEDDYYRYFALKYYIKFKNKNTKNDKYLIGVELETPYMIENFNEDEWSSLSFQEIYDIILNHKFLTKYDGSIVPGIEFVSQPQYYNDLIENFLGLRSYLFSKPNYENLLNQLDKLPVHKKKYGLHVNITKYNYHVDYELLEKRKSEFVNSMSEKSIERYFGRGYTEYTDPDVYVDSHHSIFHVKEIDKKLLIEVRLPSSTYNVEKFEKTIRNSMRIYEYLFGKMTIGELSLTLEQL